jgi:hypothetical protein
VTTDVRGDPTQDLNSWFIRGSDEGKSSNTPDTFSGNASPTTDPGLGAVPTPGSPVQDGEVVVHDS